MNIEQLAQEVWPGKVIETEQLRQELQRFHDLAIEAEHARLLEGSGEPVCSADLFGAPMVYTADQMAAAVLRYKADAEKYYALRDSGHLPPEEFDAQVMAAIRGQK